MLQTPFGSTGPGWLGISSPGLAWFPTPVAIGSSTPGAQQVHAFGATPAGVDIGPVTSTMAVDGYGPASGVTPFAPSTWGGHGMTAPLATVPLGTPFAVPEGLTAPVLMAAIGLRRGQPHGPTSDNDVEEFIYDAVELLPGAGEVEVRCEGGRVTLTGSVPHKRVKRDVGELAWAIPGINDVQNTLAISTRRRARAFTREPESQPSGAGRKQS